MKLVVDANILVGELLRKRGRELVSTPKLELYITDRALDEAEYELNKRKNLLVLRGTILQDEGNQLLIGISSLIEEKLKIAPESVYSAMESIARRRIPRDPDDWNTIALAMTLDSDIWTADYDFFGCGVAIWTTEVLIEHLNEPAE